MAFPIFSDFKNANFEQNRNVAFYTSFKYQLESVPSACYSRMKSHFNIPINNQIPSDRCVPQSGF